MVYVFCLESFYVFSWGHVLPIRILRADAFLQNVTVKRVPIVASTAVSLVISLHSVFFSKKGRLTSRWRNPKGPSLYLRYYTLDSPLRFFKANMPTKLLEEPKGVLALDIHLFSLVMQQKLQSLNFSLNLSLCIVDSRIFWFYHNNTVKKSHYRYLCVPEGSVLGPFLFSLYMKDFTFELKNCYFYTDDTVNLQSTLLKAKLVLNTDKSKFMFKFWNC